MKKTLLYIGIALVALWFSFYTENLTEKTKREEMKELKPDQLVSALMKDSLQTLSQHAISIQELKEGYADEAFAKKHGRVLGIGSPTFYVIKGTSEQVKIEDDEIHTIVDGIQLTIPLKYIFGNTAREASGWFNIDDFQNTMDFNAVSAAINAYITQQVKSFKADEHVEYIGAVAVRNGEKLQELTLIPYQLKSWKKE